MRFESKDDHRAINKRAADGNGWGIGNYPSSLPTSFADYMERLPQSAKDYDAPWKKGGLGNVNFYIFERFSAELKHVPHHLLPKYVLHGYRFSELFNILEDSYSEWVRAYAVVEHLIACASDLEEPEESWFNKMSAALEKQTADIEALQARVAELEAGEAGQAIHEAISARFLKAVLKVLHPDHWAGQPVKQKFVEDRYREIQAEVAKITPGGDGPPVASTRKFPRAPA